MNEKNRKHLHPNKRLRAAREQRGWSQAVLAEMVGTTELSIGRWERGERSPQLLYRAKLCELFHMTVEELGLAKKEEGEGTEREKEVLSLQSKQDSFLAEDRLTSSSFDTLLSQENATQTIRLPTQPAVSAKQPLLHDVSSTRSGQEAESSGKVQKKTPLLSRRLLVGGIAGLVTAGTTASVLWNAQSNSAPSQRATTISHTTSTSLPKKPPLSTLPSIGTRVFTYSRHRNYVYSIKWSSNNQRIVSASEDKTVHVWNALDGSNFLIYRGQTTRANEAAWSPDDSLIVSAASDPSVQLWHSVNGSKMYTYTGHKADVFTAKWSPDGKHIASGGLDETVQIWKASDGGTIYTYTGHSNTVNKVSWSPDGKQIASASTDRTVHVWNAADGGNPSIYQGHTARVFMAVWSPDGKRLASVGDDQTVQLWNADDGGTIHVYRGHKDAVMAVTWSPDGKRLASASIDKTVQVWDAADGSNVFTYTGHTGGVFDVAWSHDGKYIASSGDNLDQTVQIWYAETSNERSLG